MTPPINTPNQETPERAVGAGPKAKRRGNPASNAITTSLICPLGPNNCLANRSG